MLEVLFEMLLSTDMVYSRVYILYTASALYIKSYQFFYEEGILESEYIWLVSLAWIQYFRLLAGEAGNRGAFEAGNARAAAVHVILTPPVFLAQGYFLWHQSYQLHFEFVLNLAALTMSLVEALLGCVVALVAKPPPAPATQTQPQKPQRRASLIVTGYYEPNNILAPSNIDKGIAGGGLVLILLSLVWMWPFWPYETDEESGLNYYYQWGSGRIPAAFPIYGPIRPIPQLTDYT